MTIIITLLALAVVVIAWQVIAGAIDYSRNPRKPRKH